MMIALSMVPVVIPVALIVTLIVAVLRIKRPVRAALEAPSSASAPR